MLVSDIVFVSDIVAAGPAAAGAAEPPHGEDDVGTALSRPGRRHRWWTTALVAVATSAGLITAGCGGAPGPVVVPTQLPTSGVAGPPRPDHVVVVVMENHSLDQVVGNPDAPYLNQLISEGALFTEASAITHPSQPNYLALFSGDTQGVTDDGCPYSFATPNLGRQLLDARLEFALYAEGLPAAGDPLCSGGEYARKHNPVPDFTNLPGRLSQPFTAFGPDYAALPQVSFVVPNLCHDMHDCPVAAGDVWLRANLDGYRRWAATHRSLLVVTWDEAEGSSAVNRIPLVMTGQMVRPGRYAEPVDHYRVLRTLEDMVGLGHIGHAIPRTPILDTWLGS